MKRALYNNNTVLVRLFAAHKVPDALYGNLSALHIAVEKNNTRSYNPEMVCTLLELYQSKQLALPPQCDGIYEWALQTNLYARAKEDEAKEFKKEPITTPKLPYLIWQRPAADTQ